MFVDVQYDPSSDVYSVDIGIRIDNQNGDFIGVMKVVLNVEELIYIIREAERNSEYDTLKIGWFDKDGRIIYDPHIHQSQPEQVPGFFSQIDSEKKYFFYTPQGMKPQLFTYTSSQYVSGLEELNWILVVHLDTEEVYFSVNEQRNYILITTVLVVMISSVVGVIISKTLSRPISDLRQFADAISEGKQTHEISLRGPDEIQRLTKNIKKMKRDIEDQKNQIIISERLSAIEELSAKISHDIRNPLSNIQMAKELLSSQIENNEKNRELLQSMDDGIKRISHQVKNVLGYIKYRELQKTNCDLQEILQNVLNSIKIPKNIKINFSKTKAEISADSDALFRIFQNLILNSVQSIGNKKGQIGIEIIEVKNALIINIQDSGDGIS